MFACSLRIKATVIKSWFFHLWGVPGWDKCQFYSTESKIDVITSGTQWLLFWDCFFGVNVYIARTAGGSAAEYLQVCQDINI